MGSEDPGEAEEQGPGPGPAAGCARDDRARADGACQSGEGGQEAGDSLPEYCSVDCVLYFVIYHLYYSLENVNIN